MTPQAVFDNKLYTQGARCMCTSKIELKLNQIKF